MNLSYLPRGAAGKFLLLLAGVALVSALYYAGTQFPGEQGYRCQDCNVVVVSIDPMRADHMSAYGYERETTPFIDSLAEESLVFENTFAQSSHTLTSLFSTFTGMYPSRHGVSPLNTRERGFSDNFTMLAERLHSEGYRTRGIVGDVNVRGEYGFRRGFDSYRSIPDYYNENESDMDPMFEPVEDEKFFVFYQTYLLHDPYIASERYRDTFNGTVPGFREKHLAKREELRRSNLSGDTKYNRLKDYYFSRVRGNETLKRHARSEYDSSMRHADDVVKRIVNELEERGLENETVVVVTSQHGEMLGEHGAWRHHEHLYTETLKVPLVIHTPSGVQKRVEKPVELIDLSPTILDIVGPGNGTLEKQGEGSSLLELLEGKREADRFVFAEGVNHEMRTLIDTRERLRYFVDESTGLEEVYRLSSDYSDVEGLKDQELIEGMRELYGDFTVSLPERDNGTSGARPYFAS